MVKKLLTLPEIRRLGFQALLERLGPAGTFRFLQQYDSGRGDYTAERHQWLGELTLDDIVKSIKARRRKGKSNRNR
jgi:hypothetical protein